MTTVTVTPSKTNSKRLDIRFGYDDSLVASVRSLPGAKWDKEAKAWSVALTHKDKIDAFVLKANARLIAKDEADRARRAEEAARLKAQREKTDREVAAWMERDRRHAAAEASAKMEAKLAADQAAGRGRTMVLAASGPAVGAVIRLGDTVVRITGHGKTWHLGDDSSAYGAHPSWEGERVCYAYYESATDAETAALVEREKAADEAKKVAAARSSAIGRLEASKDRTHLGLEPAGETIWRDDTLAAGGYRRWVVLTSDGWLWHCVYAGGDGDTWGEYNLGYNTRGSRVRATDELVAAIRGNATTSSAAFGTADLDERFQTSLAAAQKAIGNDIDEDEDNWLGMCLLDESGDVGFAVLGKDLAAGTLDLEFYGVRDMPVARTVKADPAALAADPMRFVREAFAAL